MQPVAPKRRPRVLAGRLLAKRLPARTRRRRWLRLIFKDHQSRESGYGVVSVSATTVETDEQSQPSLLRLRVDMRYSTRL